MLPHLQRFTWLVKIKILPPKIKSCWKTGLTGTVWATQLLLDTCFCVVKILQDPYYKCIKVEPLYLADSSYGIPPIYFNAQIYENETITSKYVFLLKYSSCAHFREINCFTSLEFISVTSGLFFLARLFFPLLLITGND